MPAKNILLELGCRPHHVCRACRLALQKPITKPPTSRYYSRASRPARPPPSRTGRKFPAPAEPATAEDDNVTFRYFEMDAPGRMRPLKNNAAFVESLHSEEVQAASELDKFEDGLSKSTGLRALAERFGLVAKQEQPKAKEEGLADREDDEDDSPFAQAIDLTGLNTLQARQILQLNWHLQRTARKLEQGKVKQKTVYDTWRLYSLARPLLRNAWWRVPPEVWQLVWSILSWDGPENTNRMGRIYQLGKDMRAAGVPIDDARQILLIEAAFVDGPRKEALEAWRRFSLSPGHSGELLEEYLKLGVRMHSIHGDLERAGRALDKLLESTPRSDPRFMLPFIRACAQDKRHLDKAWETYRRMRDLLGSDMKIEDYDEVIASFLLAKQTESAFNVFVDMMFSGAIDLHGKTRLPSPVANHFFFGKWLKRLIGAGNLDGALEALRFMQTKGILAAKVQVNGLIGAWLRSGTAENLDKAETLAWAMVRSRLTFVDLRRREALVDWPIRLLQTRDKGEDLEGVLGLTFVPQASLETFSLMAENYKDRRLHARLERLWVAFQDCEISTDAFMMNQLLESYSQEGQGTKAREMYKTLTGDHSLTPDAYTFFALYKSLAVNRLYWSAVTGEIKRDEARICRELFRDMVGSSWTFESERVRQALMRMVLHSFRKCDDHVGVLVALRALRDVFGWSPDHAISMEMLAETPDLAHSKKKLFEVSRQVQAAFDASQAGKAGATPARRELTKQEGAKELVGLVEQHYVHKVGAATEKELESLYEVAIMDMGLADILLPSRAAEEDMANVTAAGAAVD